MQPSPELSQEQAQYNHQLHRSQTRKTPERLSLVYQLLLLPVGLLVGALPIVIFLALMSLGSNVYCNNQHALSQFIISYVVPISTILVILGAPTLAILALIKRIYLFAVGVLITYLPIFIISFGFMGFFVAWAMGGASIGITHCRPS